MEQSLQISDITRTYQNTRTDQYSKTTKLINFSSFVYYLEQSYQML